MEISQFIQFTYVVPVRVQQPVGAGVIHLLLLIQNLTHTHTQSAFCNIRTFFIFKLVMSIFSYNSLSHTHTHSNTHQSPTEEEAIFIHAELPRRLQDLGTHVETEQELVTLKQSSTGVSANGSNTLLNVIKTHHNYKMTTAYVCA